MITADIDFPVYVGSPLLAERSEKRGITFDRSKSDTGLAYQKTGFQFQPIEMTFSVIVNNVQGIVFESFYYSKSGLNRGIKWFNLIRKMPDGLHKVPCRFISEPSMQVISDKVFKYTAKIEVLDSSLYIPAWALIGMCDLDRAVNELWSSEVAWVVDNYDRIDYILNEVMYG